MFSPKLKSNFPASTLQKSYVLVTVVFLPQQGERVQRERQPLWVGRPYFSSRFLDTNLLNWVNTHTSLLLRISNKSNTHTSLLLDNESPKLEAAMPKRCSAEYVCISQKNKIDTLAPNSDFQTQNRKSRQICCVEHNLFALYLSIKI